MILNIINPDQGVYPATSDYVHALEVVDPRRFLFVSGTMGLDEVGSPPPTLDQQLELVWSNIRAILKDARMSVSNIVRQTSYLTDRNFAEANQKARVNALGGRIVPTTTIVVGTLDERWLIEIEVLAAA